MIGDAQDNVVTNPAPQVVALDSIVDVPAEPAATTPRILARQIAPSVSRGVQQLGGPNIVADSAGQQIRVNDDTADVVAIGNIGNGQWGIKVSPAGVDVNTATDNQLIFNSQQNVFKIIRSGTASITVTGAGSFRFQFDHELGFTPAFVAFAETASGYRSMLPAYSLLSEGGLTGRTISAEYGAVATQTIFRIYINDFAGVGVPYSTDFRYYLLQETAN